MPTENNNSTGAVAPRIVRFIGRHRVLTLATASAALVADADVAVSSGDSCMAVSSEDSCITVSCGNTDGELWCCNLFYAYLPPTADLFAGGAFVFTSPTQTLHAAMFAANPRVAGSIVLESKVVGRLQGLQLQGLVHRADTVSVPGLLAMAKRAYLKRFPFAATMLSDLWVLEVTRLKYTDNTLGFGTKLLWP